MNASVLKGETLKWEKKNEVRSLWIFIVKRLIRNSKGVVKGEACGLLEPREEDVLRKSITSNLMELW